MKKFLKERYRLFIVAIAMVLALTAILTPTLSYYIKRADELKTEYSPGEPSPPDLEEGPPTEQVVQLAFLLSEDNDTLENVMISVPNEGHPVYVRVAIIVSWMKPAECTCKPEKCDSETCCENCPDCVEGECDGCEGDCLECKVCASCKNGDESTMCPNCPDCIEGDCENCEGSCVDCEICSSCQKSGACEGCPDNCTDCENCPENCADCESCGKAENCDKCENCGSFCVDCKECPLCNDDPDDDWDIVLGVPSKNDYTLELGTPKQPQTGVSFDASLNGSWSNKDFDDKTDEYGFFYYRNNTLNRVQRTQTTTPNQSNIITIETPLIKTFKLSSAPQPPMPGCVLKLQLIVQTIQAIGVTDEGGIPAWKDAWQH